MVTWVVGRPDRGGLASHHTWRRLTWPAHCPMSLCIILMCGHCVSDIACGTKRRFQIMSKLLASKLGVVALWIGGSGTVYRHLTVGA